MRDYGYFNQDDRQQNEPVSVSELNGMIASIIASEPSLSGITVAGEVSDMRRADSGHWYFTLKDDKSMLKAVMWRSAAARQAYSGFIPETGMMVLASGDVTVYETGGIYQLNVRAIRPAGEGARYAAFLKLKQKLMSEGLMDAGRKRRLPAFIGSIALITSPSSAAARDFEKVAHARWKGIRITVVPAVMQGAAAPSSVTAALMAASKLEDAEIIAIVRGGGSAEDLWCFNDEAVARAIASAAKPVVTGIGHEVDITIADMVADMRASTPSNAAELAVPDQAAISAKLAETARRMGLRAAAVVDSSRSKLEALVAGSPMGRPMDMIDVRRQALDDMQYSMANSAERQIADAMLAFRTRAASLGALNPEAVLKRGFSICTLSDGSVVRESSQASEGDRIAIRLHKGRLGCTVDSSSR